MQGQRGLIAAVLMILLAPAYAHGGAGQAPATVAPEQKPWGIAGEVKRVVRTVEIRMTDRMRFTPDRIDVRIGQTVRFVVHNDGALLHEFVLGTRKVLDEHAALMQKFTAMEHDEPYMAHVAPGGSGEVIWTFNRPGEFDFACLMAGHYSAGMVGRIRVLPRKSAASIEPTGSGRPG